jgi:hypothetical protein
MVIPWSDDRLIVVETGPYGDSNGTLDLVDTRTDTVVASASAGVDLTAAAVATDGTGAAVGSGSGAVLRFSVSETGIVFGGATTVPAAGFLSNILVDPSDRIWVADRATNKVVLISASGTILKTLTSPISSPSALLYWSE